MHQDGVVAPGSILSTGSALGQLLLLGLVYKGTRLPNDFALAGHGMGGLDSGLITQHTICLVPSSCQPSSPGR
jgi:hypothetical protein